MKKFICSAALLSLSSLSFAMLPASEQKPQAQMQAQEEEKICLVVRKSIYGKYRKKCKSTQEWMDFLAEYGPKIEKQLETAGITRSLRGGAIYGKAPQIAYKEK
ncbi:hypothetical protein [Pseudoteredinibacter isoporae]|uniref:Uncharacterized protein n=1 Tax=Pseudoteredinibacter isoporae TaxID=570281 RepID=A0A7X0MUP9_9GAMM|nr:hypothetical protein [Pseudoteredinibacter isoporae]MBB6520518.1 hypothetical protein [Pseudoteredinibacter isoporae]NHO86085.1 hypothetical protein [Pseudoteredinibacter isoporae]NIB25464.1 hypothetical protein [Pseudoteredinibacter isoporae]